METFNDAIDLMQKITAAGGILMIVWGLITFFTALKDKTGPQLSNGLWGMISGLGVVLAAALLGTLKL